MTLAPVDAAFTARLRAGLPEGTIREVDPRYLEEPRGRWQGQAGCLAVPASAEEVASVVRLAADARVPVVPYGGGTGLVGGQLVEDGPAPVILSLERMTRIRGVFPLENTLIAEAGAILSNVHDAAEDAGRMFPLSLASEGSARIGGLLSTNAGGVNVLRYGNARDLCLGLEAVLPDGTIWHGLKRLRKDNTGYDLRNLLIGAEGTLGVITAAALKLSPIPASRGTAMMQVSSPAAALALLALARDQMGEGISAFELLSRTGFEFLSETLPDIRQPFARAPEWAVLIEVGLPAGLNGDAALLALFQSAVEAGLSEDGTIAQSDTQRQDLWSVREHLPVANRRIGSVSSHDISLPLGAVETFIQKAPSQIGALGPFRIHCFGHLGDGNLHYNVFPEKGGDARAYRPMRDDIKRVVHDLTHELGGSVSAEHGIGRLKIGDMRRYGDPAKLAAMRAIKAALDPAGIMNPGAVLPDGPAPLT